MCFFWGTTYLGIRVALESFSPAMLMCLRYTASGALLLIGAALAGSKFPRPGELWRSAWFGILIIGIGTGTLAYAEQWVPSGLAAMIVTTQPFWMVGVEAIAGGEPLHAPSIRGMLIGLVGVIVLFWPEFRGEGGVPWQLILQGFLVLQFGAVTWSIGSTAQRKLQTRSHPFVIGGVQQLATGVAFAIPAWLGPHPAAWTARGVGAIAYLAIFGGIIGYSSYILAIHRLPVALVSIYTYINPIVAVFLGWLFYRERFGWIEAAAMVIIFVGVAAVKRASAPVRAAVPAE